MIVQVRRETETSRSGTKRLSDRCESARIVLENRREIEVFADMARFCQRVIDGFGSMEMGGLYSGFEVSRIVRVRKFTDEFTSIR